MEKEAEACNDVVELCALMQCLGFNVKSLEHSDANLSHDGSAKISVVVNCQSSGIHVVLESNSALCSCPANNRQSSGFWEVSGMSAGKPCEKEFGSALLCALPKSQRDRLTKELNEIMLSIKEHHGTTMDKSNKNKSASMLELTTPEKKLPDKIPDTPTRYRSLDTLTRFAKPAEEPLPAPGALQKQHSTVSDLDDDLSMARRLMCTRQSTYTVATPDSIFKKNKTSSPIHPSYNWVGELIAAEKAAEDLRERLSTLIKHCSDDDNSSMSSLVLDVSKISVLKADTKSQFSSSPNLCRSKEDAQSRLKRFDSASTTNLQRLTPKPETKPSRLRRFSPSFFKTKKESPGGIEKSNTPDAKNIKTPSIFRAKIVKPVQKPKSNTSSGSINSLSSKDKYSHIKSTIPRPTSTKKAA